MMGSWAAEGVLAMSPHKQAIICVFVVCTQALPPDIRVLGWTPVPDDFHARCGHTALSLTHSLTHTHTHTHTRARAPTRACASDARAHAHAWCCLHARPWDAVCVCICVPQVQYTLQRVQILYCRQRQFTEHQCHAECSAALCGTPRLQVRTCPKWVARAHSHTLSRLDDV